ncbi:MAG: carbonic anhydrase [Gammaproteobacteria bacterium]|nr:MAG: carbonic anhydrase [Gammaproteobacteria bacterium]
MISAEEALQKLQEGNRRYLRGEANTAALSNSARRQSLTGGQNPFAIILGCSDSRVPAEIVFDQGLGDLFVIRVAGNIVAPSQIGSIEFAAERFGTPLVVILGHSQCGAVSATIEELERPAESRSPNLRSIVDRIRPAVEPLMDTELRQDRKRLLDRAVHANIRAAANQLRHGSAILERLIDEGRLRIVEAHYSLETGEVHFDDPSEGFKA